MFAWWGRTVYRYRFVVIAVTVALCLGGGIFGMSLGKHVTQSGFYDDGSESARASVLADQVYGRDRTSHIVAIFTAPAHPNWGGTALIGPAGDLLGIGSLQLERATEKDKSEHLNMVVPIDDLKPIYDDLMKFGRPNRPPRPWLGLYATEIEDKIVVVGLASRGPAQKADIRTGDIILAVAGPR